MVTRPTLSRHRDRQDGTYFLVLGSLMMAGCSFLGSEVYAVVPSARAAFQSSVTSHQCIEVGGCALLPGSLIGEDQTD